MGPILRVLIIILSLNFYHTKSFAIFDEDLNFVLKLKTNFYDSTAYTPFETPIDIMNPPTFKGQVQFLIDDKADILDDDVTFSVRGNSRVRDCRPFPLKAELSRKFEHPFMKGITKLKIVNYCLARREGNIGALVKKDAEQLLFMEFLGYKIYELLSPHAFKTVLFENEISIQNSFLENAYGFIVQTNGQLDKAREDLKELTDLSGFLNKKTIFDKDSFLRVIIFNYLIGNGDWNFLAGSSDDKQLQGMNITYYQEHSSNKVVPVPDDFDRAKIIWEFTNRPYNLPYAKMSRVFELPIRKTDILKVASQIYLKRKDILSLIENFKLLDDERKNHMRDFLEDRFQKLSSKKELSKLLTGCNDDLTSCINPPSAGMM